MSKGIIGVTVGTPISVAKIGKELMPELKIYINEQMGDVEAALDRIIAIQNELIGGLITFTVVGNTLNAKQGMTWGEFADSEYNIYGYYIREHVVCGTHADYYVTNEDGSYVAPTDVIRHGAKYSHG